MGGWISWKYSHLSPAKAEARAELGNFKILSQKKQSTKPQSLRGWHLYMKDVANKYGKFSYSKLVADTEQSTCGSDLVARCGNLTDCGG